MSEKRSLQEIIKWEKRYQAFGLEKLCAWDFAHDNGQNPAATGVARKYADHFEELRQDGTGLSIFGGAGAGKSYLAAEIVSDLTDRGYHCLFTNMNTVMIELIELNTMAFEGRRDFLAQICDKDLLVLDDLGSEPETSYCNQIFIQIVNTCLTRNVPLLFTSAFHEDILTKEGSNAKRAMAVTRLLKRNISYTVLMPGERRNTNLEQKRKAEAMVSKAGNDRRVWGTGGCLRGNCCSGTPAANRATESAAEMKNEARFRIRSPET